MRFEVLKNVYTSPFGMLIKGSIFVNKDGKKKKFAEALATQGFIKPLGSQD